MTTAGHNTKLTGHEDTKGDTGEALANQENLDTGGSEEDGSDTALVN